LYVKDESSYDACLRGVSKKKKGVFKVQLKRKKSISSREPPEEEDEQATRNTH